jgi:cobyrinic acid a,c-diamide synthase
MYLARSIRWGDASHEMAGVIPADAVMHTRPQGRGLAVLEETADAPWPAASPAPPTIPAHEFHYASLENLEPSLRFAYKVVRGDGIRARQDGIVHGNLLASFCHLRATAANPWVDRFLSFVRAQRGLAYNPRNGT